MGSPRRRRRCQETSVPERPDSRGRRHYGVAWPIHYRTPVTERLATLEALGVRAFPALVYPHKADMAAWLSEWARAFAAATPGCVPSGTFYPEPGVAAYVDAALEAGTRVFKVHLQVGGYDPRADELDPVWGRLAEAGVPVIAHLSMPEYAEYLGLAERYPNVHLDTTMAFTPFTEALMPMPPELRPRLAGLPHHPPSLRRPAGVAGAAGPGRRLAAGRLPAQRRPAAPARAMTTGDRV